MINQWLAATAGLPDCTRGATTYSPYDGSSFTVTFSVTCSSPAGSVSETVNITEEIPLVNVTSAVLGGTLSNETINDLPLNGRNFTLLLEMRPGVVLTLGNDSGGAGAAATNGLRPENSNEYLVEGLHGMSPFNGQPVMNSLALRGDAATVLPVDAIQEFNQQFNGKAEYGWRAGGTTNITGTLTSANNTTYRIEFFATPPSLADATNGEGRLYLGFATVTTNGSDTTSAVIQFTPTFKLGFRSSAIGFPSHLTGHRVTENIF